MSLARMILRLATARALSGQTLAGNRIFDSAIDPLDLRIKEDPAPVLVVYTDDHEGSGEGQTAGFRMLSDVDLVIEMAVAGAATIPVDPDGAGGEPALSIMVPHTDAAMELQLDMIERQVISALTTSASPWGDLWRQVTLTVIKTMSRRGANAEHGARFAARQLTITVRTIHDPTPGYVIEAGSVWAAFVAAVTADAGMAPLAPLFASVIESGDLSEWRRRASEIGVSRDVAVLLGFGPLSGLDDNPQPFTEFAFEAGLEVVTPPTPPSGGTVGGAWNLWRYISADAGNAIRLGLDGKLYAHAAPPAGAGAVVFDQLAPASFWSFVNPLGRLAAIAVYGIDGEEVGADVVCTPSSVTVTFAQPFAGRLVLN